MMLNYNIRSADRKDLIAYDLDAFALEMGALECVATELALSPFERGQIELFEAMFDDLVSDNDDAEITDDEICKSATIPVQEKPSLSKHLHNVTDIRATPCSVAPLTPLTTPTLAPTISPYTKPVTGKKKGKVRAAPRTLSKRPSPSWREATPAQKFNKAVRSTAAYDALAFSLNLSSDRQMALVRHADPIRLFSGYLNRELRRAGLSGIPYAFTLELSPDGKKLHLHGVILPGAEPVAVLKQALQAAGGKIEGRAGSRQVKLDPITNAGGWAAYCQKEAWLTEKVIDGDRLTFISANLNRITREYAPQLLAA